MHFRLIDDRLIENYVLSFEALKKKIEWFRENEENHSIKDDEDDDVDV